jgi:hypothetical protein
LDRVVFPDPVAPEMMTLSRWATISRRMPGTLAWSSADQPARRERTDAQWRRARWPSLSGDLAVIDAHHPELEKITPEHDAKLRDLRS